MTPTESTASCNAVRILTHEEFAQELAIDRQPSAPIDRGAPLTYRVQMPKIDVARLNALRPKPKPSDNPPETIRIPSDDATDPMEVDRVPMGRTLRKINEKVAKHLKRGANEKERESFQKRVFRIPLEKPFNEAYFTHRLWMFFRETRETEEDIRRMFCEAREKMRKRITLKKKSDSEQFAIPCTVKGIEFPHALSLGGIVGDLEVQIGNALVFVDFHVLDIKLNWNSSLLLGRAFLSTVGAVCKLQTNQLCLTLIDPHTHYNPIPVKKPQTILGVDRNAHNNIDRQCPPEIQKLTDILGEESVDSSPEDWESDSYNPTLAAHIRHTMHTEEYGEGYEEERATEYIVILDEEDKLLHHSSWKRNAPSIDRTVSTSIDTQSHHINRKRASTDIAYYPSIDTGVDRVREGDYSIGNELHEGFTYEELLNMKRRDEVDQHQAEATGERTQFGHSIDRATRPSINEKHPSSIDIHSKPISTVSENPNFDNLYLIPDEFGIFKDTDGYAREIDGHPLQVSREDIADILQMANGADNLFMQQHTFQAHQQRVTKEFYDTAGGIDNRFKKKHRHPTRPSIDFNVLTSIDRRPEFGRKAFDLSGTREFYWEEKDEYGVY
ncbi:hypothetical protein F2Q68_00044068 [Brassica cretica]|uniref:Aspartic peptidase DDI1-type domain-containing protein n=1 Tax=Brassica cretica TaxID=69181 RepID=A0A8S9LM31_BRACR|nr:hypothetical protein F2Q68_00044068 [Brassica cretica]